MGSDDDKKGPAEAPPDQKETAYRLWLAGLGALTVGEEEGLPLFDYLIARGRAIFEADTKLSTMAQSREKRGSTSSTIPRADDSLNQALHGLGLPPSNDAESLQQLRALTDQTVGLQRTVREILLALLPGNSGKDPV